MIPKVIHLCWFSDDPYPVEIKVCLDTWKRPMPDYVVKVWDYAAAKSIGCAFIDEALEARKWAFAADVVRFYAVYKEGGIYMDSDIYLLRRFDEILPRMDLSLLVRRIRRSLACRQPSLWGQLAMRSARRCLSIIRVVISRTPDGSFNVTISPYTMSAVAKSFGWQVKDENLQKRWL